MSATPSAPITAYAFARIANAELKAHGMEREPLPPQMFYTYAKKGFITLTEQGAVEWAYKYASKHGLINA
jgi:hypothetical protein